MVKKGKEVSGPVNLNDVISEVLRLVRSDALERDCMLVTEPDPELPLVRGDGVQLQQVLLNLVVNACRPFMWLTKRIPSSSLVLSNHRQREMHACPATLGIHCCQLAAVRGND
jgi:phosphoglycerate-specific signal transduction histidine kinase